MLKIMNNYNHFKRQMDMKLTTRNSATADGPCNAPCQSKS